MYQAAVPGFRLSRSKTSTKVLTSLGLVGLLLGLTMAAVLTMMKTGISASSVMQYYLGNAGGVSGADALMADARRPAMEIAEITHFHLTGGSLLLFLLCHLLALCDISEKLRIWLYTISFGSFITTFSLPWLILYGAPQFAYAYGPSMFVLLVSLFFLAAIPLRDMWFSQA